jgi:hypothetical protein
LTPIYGVLRLPGWTRDILVVLLAVTTGVVDAVCFLHVGKGWPGATLRKLLLGLAAVAMGMQTPCAVCIKPTPRAGSGGLPAGCTADARG